MSLSLPVVLEKGLQEVLGILQYCDVQAEITVENKVAFKNQKQKSPSNLYILPPYMDVNVQYSHITWKDTQDLC